MVDKQKLEYVSLIRVLVTFFVILFHSYAIYLYPTKLNIELPSIQIYKDIFIVEERIQMPLFIFISGFLFRYIWNEGGYKSYQLLIEKKVKRLLIPYMFFFALFYFTLPKFVTVGVHWYNSFIHLWFLLSLFECFLLQVVIIKLTKSKAIYFSIPISIIMSLVDTQIPNLFAMNSFFTLFLYFVVGFYSMNLLKRFQIKFTFALPLFIVLAFACIYFDNKWDSNMIMKLLRHIILPVTSFLSIYCIFFLAKKYTKGLNSFMKKMDKASMGLYIFHLWIMFNLLAIPGIATFACIHYIIYPILMFVTLTILSYYITILFKKIPMIGGII